MDGLEAELKTLVVDALMLDEVPDDLDEEADLFETLGIDSVEALELVMAVRRKYGVQFDAQDEQNKAVFANLRSLADYIRARRPTA